MHPSSRPALTRYRALLEVQRARTAGALGAAWDQLGRYDEADVETFAKLVGPTIAGAKQATVATSAAFNSYMLGIPAPPLGADAVTTVADLRSPFTTTWRALAEGRRYEDAVAAGRSFAEATGETFIQSTARQAGDAVAATIDRPVRFERVAEPNACEWCQERDGTIYLTSSDGDYGHERCNCDVVPFEGD